MAPAIEGAEPVPAKNTASFVSGAKGQKEVAPMKFDFDPKLTSQPIVAAAADPVKYQPGTGQKAVVYFGTGTKINAKASYVNDGDTAWFKDAQNRQFECRVDMIDAPETPKKAVPGRSVAKPGQPYGQEATNALRSMLGNGEVQVTVVEGVSAKNYNRHLCRIEIEGKDVSLEMIKGGHAFLYDEFAAPLAFRQAQLQAKAQDRGVWRGEGDPERPKPYRDRYKPLDKAEERRGLQQR